MILTFIIGIGISWLIWSFLIPKWRLWAFNQVDEDDWGFLKESAINNLLIWEDGHSFEKTEIRSKKESRQINKINERISELKQIEAIKLDLATPQKLGFKLNKKKIILEVLLQTLFLVYVFFSLFTKAAVFALIIFLFVAADGFSFKFIKHLSTNNDYLIFSEKGIQIIFPMNIFIRWEDILLISIPVEKKLTIKIKKDNREEKITLNLARFKIGTRRIFVKKLKVFIDRYKQYYD